MPGAASVVGRGTAVRVRAGHRPAMAAAAGALGRPHDRRADGRASEPPRAVQGGARRAPPQPGAGRWHPDVGRDQPRGSELHASARVPVHRQLRRRRRTDSCQQLAHSRLRGRVGGNPSRHCGVVVCVTLPFAPTVLALALAVFAAFIIGVSKTSVGGVATLAVGIFAQLMPAKESTAAVLLLLIIGDVIGVWTYHKHADWGLLKKLLPSVLPGIALGALFVRFVPDVGLKKFIGVILVVMLVLQLISRRKPAPANDEVKQMHPAATISTGVGAGFTTMTASAAGPFMSLYPVSYTHL